MLIPKKKNVHLSGQAKTDLRNMIFVRDGYKCIICHQKGTQWHHEPPGSNKSDELSKGVVLCDLCHTKRHSQDYDHAIRNEIRRYLGVLYGNTDGES